MGSQSLVVAALQGPSTGSLEQNVEWVEEAADDAGRQGAQLVVPPELFEGPYFCSGQQDHFFALARPIDGHPTIARLAAVARRRKLVVLVPIFEQDGPHFFNSVAVVDADGETLGVYRKSHIPDGPGYQEKFYFRPGGGGFRVFTTRYAAVGVGICWDQWFPEAARAMTLMGAELLAYPSTIGAEPHEPELDTRPLWQDVMRGHAIANMIPVVASNRTGEEDGTTFFGHAFISDHFGRLLADAGQATSATAMAKVDLAEAARRRASFGFFRDRRPELYHHLVSSS